MEVTPLLCESNHCRLCAEENKNGIYLFSEDENSNNLALLVNRYLPVRVENDSKFPKYICPGCHIQLEATKLFLDLIVEGQSKLRTIYHSQFERLQREAKQKQQLEEALQSVNPNSTVETYSIHTDESGDKYLIQIVSDGPLFPPEHELSLKAEGLEKPKRKRGRPPKQIVDASKANEEDQEKNDNVSEPAQDDEEIVGEDGRKRRKIKAPSRFAGEVQGIELEKIFKEEGVLDEETLLDDKGTIPSVEETVIGRTESETGEDLGEPIFIHRPKIRSKTGYLKKSKKKYRCDICKKEFFHHGRCESHKKSHNIYYVCQSGCEFESKEKSELEKHQLMTEHTGISVIDKQEDIGGVLQLPNGAETAVEQLPEPDENVRERPECSECGKSYSTKYQLCAHARAIHSNERPFECPMKCGERFAYANSAKAHAKRHEREEGTTRAEYPCDQCDKVMLHPSSLLYHQESEHNNGRRFVCTTCNRSFKHRQLLQRHQMVHSEDRPYACDKCSATFKTHANLLSHEAVHTGEKKFCCGRCGQKFAYRTSLTFHQRWHDGLKPFACDFCDKSFSQKGNLSEHRRIHTGEKPFYCDRCGKSFTTSSQFNTHLKRHTGEKPFTCEYCSKSFRHKDRYRSHLRRHLNQREHACAVCARAFTDLSALKRHERTHTGHKPYRCEHCPKRFADISNKNKHARIHSFAGNVKYVPKDVATDGGELQLTQLFDRRGNPISVMTETGETMAVVTLGDDRETFRGLMPDGRLVPIEIAAVEEEGEKNEGEPVELNLIDGTNQEAVILSSESIIQVNSDALDPNLQLFAADGGQEMCLVTYALDENGEVTQDLVDPLLLQS